MAGSVGLVLVACAGPGGAGVVSTTTTTTTTAVTTTTTSTSTAATTTTTTTITTTTTTPTPSRPSSGWNVVFVADGDTFDVVRGERRLTVRLLGINAPELGECGHDEARATLRRLLAPGPVLLVRDRTNKDALGRVLRYAENASGVDVGASLVVSGRAVSRRDPPDTARNGRYDALERRARRAQRGLWADGACGGSDVAISIEVHADAAGRDDENLNDEWVRFRNDGTKPVRLDGFVVGDESTSNRYTFRGVVVPSGRAVTLVTGCGRDRPLVRHWCTDGYPVWNNEGDTVFLRDRSGANVAVLAY